MHIARAPPVDSTPSTTSLCCPAEFGGYDLKLLLFRWRTRRADFYEGGKKKNRLPVREQLPSSHCISLICSAREFSTSMGYFFKRLPP